ncbi:hypothetical protein ACHQM5_003745 [Ranunculus cassubicifolius]
MANLVGVHSFRRPTTQKVASNNDMAINLCLSHTRICYHNPLGIGVGRSSASSGATPAAVAHANFKNRKSRGVDETHLAPRSKKIRARAIRWMLSPGSYLLKKLRALIYSGGVIMEEDNKATATTKAANEVMVVEPYFAMPVVPVTTGTVFQI